MQSRTMPNLLWPTAAGMFMPRASNIRAVSLLEVYSASLDTDDASGQHEAASAGDARPSHPAAGRQALFYTNGQGAHTHTRSRYGTLLCRSPSAFPGLLSALTTSCVYSWLPLGPLIHTTASTTLQACPQLSCTPFKFNTRATSSANSCTTSWRHPRLCYLTNSSPPSLPTLSFRVPARSLRPKPSRPP